ncbi:hypothetical protein b3_0165 [Synechococcus phage B3]|nr:hypothetical protein b3_0165 [Synechococcus phage B3]QGT54779.1 hypothetical protein b23_0164 [Synechococcus phage B23]
MEDKAKQFLYSYMDKEKDLSQPKILIHMLQELINQYSSSLPPDPNMDEFYSRMYGGESVIYVDDILTLINDLNNV